MRWVGAAWVIVCVWVTPVQADTLADVQSDIAGLTTNLEGLRLQLQVSRDDNPAFTGGLIDRVDAMERELRRMTRVTEELEFRIRQFDSDMGQDIAALTNRLCQLDPSCDAVVEVMNPDLEDGRDVPRLTSPTDATQTNAFAQAQALFVAGDGAGALAAVDAFIARYPSSPLVADAYLLKGQIALEAGQLDPAARAFLSGYVSDPNSETGADALYQLGNTFDALGHNAQACGVWGEVMDGFPNTDAAAAASDAANTFGCP